MSNPGRVASLIKVKKGKNNDIRFLNLETAQEYETLPEGIDPSMVKYTWDEIVSQDGNVVGYECLENNAYLAFNKKHTIGSISVSGDDSRGTSSYIDRNSDLYTTINRGREDTYSHNNDSSFLNQPSTFVPSKLSKGGTALHSKQESMRAILPNSESDKDAAIRKQSFAIAESVTNRLHPHTAFVTHGDWRRVVDGNMILYFDPITNVISSTLPDGYPIEPEEFLYDDFLHSDDNQHLNATVCRMNRLFSKVREQLEIRRLTSAENSSRSVSSNPKWKESDSLSQPSGISFRSESGLLHARTLHEEDSESCQDIKENAILFLHDINQPTYSLASKRRLNLLSEHFERTASSSSLLNRRGSEEPISTLVELRNMLFDEEDELPPTLTMLSDCINSYLFQVDKMIDDKIPYDANYFKPSSYNIKLKYASQVFKKLLVDKVGISLIGSDRIDINYEEIDSIVLLDLNNKPVSGFSQPYSVIQMTFKRPSDIILRDLIKDKGLKPMQIHFAKATERLEFCITLFNVKRMYHEVYVRNQLFREYRHDMRRASVTWFITEVSIDGAVPYRLTWFLPKASLDLGHIAISTRLNEKKYVIHVNDIVGIIPGKRDVNYVCTVHILLKSERKTYAFENELNRSEFLNLARNCIGDEIVKRTGSIVYFVCNKHTNPP